MFLTSHMTVGDLKEFLEDYDEDTEVRIAYQPTWPFEASIKNEITESDGVIYLAEEKQLGYLPGDVTDELGWGDGYIG